MDSHPVLDVVGPEVLGVLQDLPRKDEAQVLDRSVVKLCRYGLFKLKHCKNAVKVTTLKNFQTYLPDLSILLNLHSLLLFRSLYLDSDHFVLNKQCFSS